MTARTRYTSTMKTLQYLFIIERAGKNFSGYFPDVPGCVTSAKTVEKTLQSAVEALGLHLEEDHKPPRPRTLAWHLDKGGLTIQPTDIVTWVPFQSQPSLLTA